MKIVKHYTLESLNKFLEGKDESTIDVQIVRTENNDTRYYTIEREQKQKRFEK